MYIFLYYTEWCNSPFDITGDMLNIECHVTFETPCTYHPILGNLLIQRRKEHYKQTVIYYVKTNTHQLPLFSDRLVATSRKEYMQFISWHFLY
jgi:hypothetical protein